MGIEQVERLGDTQEQFAERVGLRRRITVTLWKLPLRYDDVRGSRI
jgi:hypothetical protein